MCLGVPGKVVEINGRNATVDVLGAERGISLELLEGVKTGDYVLIHAGCAIQIVDEEEAAATISLFNELRDIVNE